MPILMSTWTVLKDLKKKNCLIENISVAEEKKGKNEDDGKKTDGHISFKDYLTCENIFNKFEMKNMVIITIII